MKWSILSVFLIIAFAFCADEVQAHDIHALLNNKQRHNRAHEHHHTTAEWRQLTTVSDAVLLSVDNGNANGATDKGPEWMPQRSMDIGEVFNNKAENGPAKRLGFDTAPRPFFEDTKPVKHYNFTAVPERSFQAKAPKRVEEVIDSMNKRYWSFIGIFVGVALLIPIILGYLLGGSEYAIRNLMFATVALGSLCIITVIAHKMGSTQAAYEVHVFAWGRSWFLGLIVAPLVFLFFVQASDLAVRGPQSTVWRNFSALTAAIQKDWSTPGPVGLYSGGFSVSEEAYDTFSDMARAGGMGGMRSPSRQQSQQQVPPPQRDPYASGGQRV